MKMYKYRIKKWNLRKYLRHGDVEEFVRSNKPPEVRGAKASQRQIDKYLQQRRRYERAAKRHDPAPRHVNTVYDDHETAGAPSMALSVVANRVRLPRPSLFSPRSPDGLRLLEGSIHAMRSYTSGNFDAKTWVLDSRGGLNVRDRALEWHGAWYTVRHLMDAGRAKQAFRVVQKCNQVFEEILVSDSPTFFSSAFLVFLGISSSWPELAASVLRYMHSLSRIRFGDSNHPMVEFLSNICKLGMLSEIDATSHTEQFIEKVLIQKLESFPDMGIHSHMLPLLFSNSSFHFVAEFMLTLLSTRHGTYSNSASLTVTLQYRKF